MSNIKSIQKIREIFSNNSNILDFLKNGNINDTESIMISYDFQAGSYIKFASENSEYIDSYTNQLIDILSRLGKFSSIMEVGVGEATILSPLFAKLDPENYLEKFGFDISWSRARYAKDYCEKFGVNAKIFTANLFSIPLPDNSIDIVYTSHSLEPNGGKEKEALNELYRVAAKFIVLLEPDYNNATSEGKTRMDKHCYVKNLDKHAIELGYEIIENKPLDIYINYLNPTGLTIIKKNYLKDRNEPNFTCPITSTQLEKFGNVYYSAISGLMYPIINDVSCLLQENAILGTKFKEFNI